MNRVMRRLPFAGLLFLFLAAAGLTWAADFSIEAEVDRTTVKFGESLQLTVRITQALTRGNDRVGTPHIAQIPGFDIAGQQSSQNMTIINGVGQIQVQTLFNLVPQKAGTFTIPPLNVSGPDGRMYSTKPIQVVVQPPAQEEEEASTAGEEPDEERRSSGAGRLQTILTVVFFVLASIIGAPILLTYLLNRNAKPSTRWQDEEPATIAGEAKRTPTGSPNAAARNLRPPAAPGTEVEDAVIASPGPKPLAKVDFEREVSSLQRNYPDGGIEFFREFFDLFRRAVQGRTTRLDPNMTPDELIRQIAHLIPSEMSSRARTLGEDWEAVFFAHAAPGRPWRTILEDALAVLAAIPPQE